MDDAVLVDSVAKDGELELIADAVLAILTYICLAVNPIEKVILEFGLKFLYFDQISNACALEYLQSKQGRLHGQKASC
jgi:hypothetical protein